MAGAARSSLCLCKNFGKLSICKRNGRGFTVITLPLQEVRRLTVKVNGRTSPKVSAKIYCKQRLHLFDKTWTEVMATSMQVDEQEGRNNPSNLLLVTLTLRKKVETLQLLILLTLAKRRPIGRHFLNFFCKYLSRRTFYKGKATTGSDDAVGHLFSHGVAIG